MQRRIIIGTPKKLPMPRYIRGGQCNRCGWCCTHEDCDHFKPASDGIATCLIFGSSERPEKCLVYPGNPPILHPGCGYYFIDQWENNKVVKAGDSI